MELKPYLRRAMFYETDGMGIIYHGNYIHWMEEARVDYLDQLGWGYDKALEEGIDFAVYEVSCRYHAMTRFGDQVAITVELTALSPARAELTYYIRDAESGELKAEGVSRHFFYDRAAGRPTALKKAMPDLYAIMAGLLKKQEG